MSGVPTNVQDELVRMERRLSAQFEERLRSQREEYEERLRVQREEITATCDERMHVLTTVNEELLRVLEEKVDTLQARVAMHHPLSFDDLPLELIALVSNFVDNVDDLASMSLVSHHVRNGVLLSRPWIVVEEIVAATAGNVKFQRVLLHDRYECAVYACKNGIIRVVRALNLSRREVIARSLIRSACSQHGLEIIKYLHRTYALTAEELNSNHLICTPMIAAVMGGHIDIVRYLHTVAGVTVTRTSLVQPCGRGRLELKYLHTELRFTVDDDRDAGVALSLAIAGGHRECLIYLRDGFGLTADDAWRVYDGNRISYELYRSIQLVGDACLEVIGERW